MDICGKASIRAGLVVNGEQARPGEFPFLVALYKYKNDKFFCAGNLITRRHVLSGECKICIIFINFVVPLKFVLLYFL